MICLVNRPTTQALCVATINRLKHFGMPIPEADLPARQPNFVFNALVFRKCQLMFYMYKALTHIFYIGHLRLTLSCKTGVEYLLLAPVKNLFCTPLT